MAAKAEIEHGPLPETVADDRLAADLATLHARLDEAELTSSLPEQATAEPALHDLLIRLRTGT